MKIKRRMFALVTCLLLTSLACPPMQASTITNIESIAPSPIKKIVRTLAKGNIFILHMPVQPSPIVAVQQENYTQLEQIATSAELETLILQNKNAVVRLYAFKALAKQMENIGENIMQVINKDSSEIAYFNRDKKEKARLNILAQNFLN